MYYIPKIHKDKSNPPGRPIVSRIESLTSRLGKYIDTHLQPLVRGTKAFLKDTKHTLQMLKECDTNGNTVMATADVALLYTNIDHQGAIRAVKWALKKKTSIKRKQRKFILKSLEFGLKHNYIWYENVFYSQIRCRHGR